MTPEQREAIIETALSSEFKDIWNWERDVVEFPFGPDDTDYINSFEERVCELRQTAQRDLRNLSDEELARLNEKPLDRLTMRTELLGNYLSFEPKKVRLRCPPAIAYGYGHPHFSPDFTYWCQMPALSLYEAVALSVGDDPERVTEDKIIDLKKNSASRTDLWAAHKFLLKRLEQFVRFYPTTGYGFRAVPLKTLDDWFKEIDLDIYPGFRAAIDKRLEGTVHTVKTSQDTLTAQERTTLLKLIAAMACEQYGYDPSVNRSEVPSRISDDLDLVGLSLDPKTIRKWLRDAAELVDETYWRSGP